MSRALAALGAMLLASACTPSDPAVRAAADWADCVERPNPMRQAEACTGVIENRANGEARRATALINRATLRADEGQYARAIADLGRALRLSPDDPRVLVERGRIHMVRGAFDEALRSVEAALALDRSSATALQLREQLISARGIAGQSQIERVSEALARDPRNAQLLNERCWLRAVEGVELELALADCDAALAAEPNFGAAFDSRGLVNLKRGALAQALADYEAALKIEPGRGHYLYGRGLVRIALGERAEGEADLAAGEAAEPGVAALYRSYGVGA